MTSKTMKALALLLASGAISAGALEQEPETAPQLRVTQMTGELQVTPPGMGGAAAGQKLLPYIKPGSVVRVISGAAIFESDSHATVTATDGDAFLFTAEEQQGATPAGMSIASIGPSPAIHVRFADKRFLLRQDGAIAIASAVDGESPVTVMGGSVELMSGSMLNEGESISFAIAPPAQGGMSPYDRVSVLTSKGRGFEMLPLDLASLSISAQDTETFSARTLRPKVASAQGPKLSPDKAIASWPENSRLMAELMMEKYGQPDSVGTRSLSWTSNGPWKRTVVHKVGVARGVPQSRAVLEQFVSYDVPPGLVGALTRMSVGLKADRARKELSAASGSEATNFLALNLADDVVTGKVSPAEAAESFQRAVSLAEAGKSSDYLKGLRFDPRGEDGAPE